MANEAPPPDHQTTEPRSQNVILVGCQAETVVGLPWAADSCPLEDERGWTRIPSDVFTSRRQPMYSDLFEANRTNRIRMEMSYRGRFTTPAQSD
jgi:hypothetical protein